MYTVLPRLPTSVYVSFACLVGILAVALPLKAQMDLVIDPGHGGVDPGAVGCGLREADLALDISGKMFNYLNALGVKVEMTRYDDSDVSLAGRVAYARNLNAKLFHSVHINAFTSASATGSETFCSPGDTTECGFASKTHARMMKVLGLTDRGVKSANFYVIRHNPMPAILTEPGFISNCNTDAPLLGDPAVRQQLAEGYAQAALEQLGLDPNRRPDNVPDAQPSEGPRSAATIIESRPITLQPSRPQSDPAPSQPQAETNYGVLAGNIYRDRGLGADDTSERLEGATIHVATTGQTAVSEAGTGAYRLDVRSGVHSIYVSYGGTDYGPVECRVLAGQLNYCVIGIAFEEGELVAPEDFISEALNEEVVSELDRDFGPSQSELNPASGAYELRATEVSACGVSSEASPLGMALLSLFVWGLLRRRRALGLLLVLLAACKSGKEAPEPVVSDLKSTQMLRVASRPNRERALVEAPALAATTRLSLTSGGLASALLSPEGDAVLVSAKDYKGLRLITWSQDFSAEERVISTQRNAGYFPRWSADGDCIAFRAPEQPMSALPLHARDRLGQPCVITGPRVPVARVRASRIEGLREGTLTVLAEEKDDRVFGPQLSPDGRLLLYYALRGGLVLKDLVTEQVWRLGAGLEARFDPCGETFVYAKIEDDGQVMTRSSLWQVRPEALRLLRSRIALEDAHLPRSPSLSCGGHRLAYVDDGLVFVADLAAQAVN